MAVPQVLFYFSLLSSKRDFSDFHPPPGLEGSTPLVIGVLLLLTVYLPSPTEVEPTPGKNTARAVTVACSSISFDLLLPNSNIMASLMGDTTFAVTEILVLKFCRKCQSVDTVC
jgi:hypothetical protein